MEKALIEDMLELAKREKARWEKVIRELNLQVKPATVKAKAKAEPDSKAAKAEKDVAQILNAADDYLGPTQVVAKGEALGIKVESNMVRQVLSRGRDKRFVSPERGKWTTKEKAKEMAESLPLR